jgi:hypothetical protein
MGQDRGVPGIHFKTCSLAAAEAWLEVHLKGVMFLEMDTNGRRVVIRAAELKRTVMGWAAEEQRYKDNKAEDPVGQKTRGWVDKRKQEVFGTVGHGKGRGKAGGVAGGGKRFQQRKKQPGMQQVHGPLEHGTV